MFYNYRGSHIKSSGLWILCVLSLALNGCVLRVADHPDATTDNSHVSVHWLDIHADSALSQAVRTRLESDPLTHNAQLRIHSDDGNVLLTGITDKPDVLAQAIKVTLATQGVKGVYSGVTVTQ